MVIKAIYQLSTESLSYSYSDSSYLSFSPSSFKESFLHGEPFSFVNITGLSSKLCYFFHQTLIFVIFFLKSQRQRSQSISSKNMMLIPLAYFASQLQGMKQRMKKSQIIGKCQALFGLKTYRYATLPSFLLKQFRQTSSPCQTQQLLANLVKSIQQSQHFYETNSPTLMRQTIRARSRLTVLLSLISVCRITLIWAFFPCPDGQWNLANKTLIQPFQYFQILPFHVIQINHLGVFIKFFTLLGDHVHTCFLCSLRLHTIMFGLYMCIESGI